MSPDTIPGLTLTMAGTPRPQPRARHVGGKVVSTADPKARAFRDALQGRALEAVSNVGGAAALAVAWGGRALVVDLAFTFPTRFRLRWGKPHAHKPDKDNLEKMVLDCLGRAGALGGDDSRVASGVTSKIWGPVGRTAITVRLAPDTTSQPQHDKTAQPPAWLVPLSNNLTDSSQPDQGTTSSTRARRSPMAKAKTKGKGGKC